MSPESTTADWDRELAQHLRKKLRLYRKTTPQPYPAGFSVSSKDMWLASIRETELFQAHGTFAESVPQNVQRDRRNDMDGTLEQIVQDSDVDYEYFEGYCLWEFKSRKTKIGEVDQWVVRRHCWRGGRAGGDGEIGQSRSNL